MQLADSSLAALAHLREAQFRERDEHARSDFQLDRQDVTADEVLGPRAEAIEPYPSEDRLIDQVNGYHLFSDEDLLWVGFDLGKAA